MELEKKIIEEFKDNSIRRDVILKKYNISKAKLFRILRNHGVPTRNKFRKYFYNENYFDVIDTPDKAQILGFLYADGCVYKTKLSVSLEQTDKQYLLDILSKLETTSETLRYIKAIKRMGPSGELIHCKPQYSFTLSSAKLTKACKLVGLIPRKSSINLQFPSEEIVPRHLQKYFILGVLEGDGSINISKPWNKDGRNRKYGTRRVAFCGSENMMIGIRNVILRDLNCDCKVRKYSNSDKCYDISYSRVNEVTKILHWLYDDSTFHMQRKFDKAQEVLKINISH